MHGEIELEKLTEFKPKNNKARNHAVGEILDYVNACKNEIDGHNASIENYKTLIAKHEKEIPKILSRVEKWSKILKEWQELDFTKKVDEPESEQETKKEITKEPAQELAEELKKSLTDKQIAAIIDQMKKS